MSKKKKTTNKKSNEQKENIKKNETSEVGVLDTKKTKENKKTNKKENKNNRKKSKEEQNTDSSSNEMIKLLKIVLIVTAIMLLFYGITLLVTNKADEKLDNQQQEQTPSETPIQYENIMIGSLLNHNGTYYVLIEKDDDNRLAEYDSLIGTIKASEDAPTIYKANLTDSFNKNYLGKEANYYVDDIAEFKVTGTTLVKVQDGKIVSVHDNHDDIKNKLTELS